MTVITPTSKRDLTRADPKTPSWPHPDKCLPFCLYLGGFPILLSIFYEPPTSLPQMIRLLAGAVLPFTIQESFVTHHPISPRKTMFLNPECTKASLDLSTTQPASQEPPLLTLDPKAAGRQNEKEPPRGQCCGAVG